MTDLAPKIAITMFIISLIGLPFALAAMFAGSNADDSDDALIARIKDGDIRLSDVMKPPVHGSGYSE